MITKTAGGIIDLRSQLDTNFGVGLAETGFTVVAGTDLTFAEANTRSGSIVINAGNINGGSILGGLDGSDAGNDFITVDAAGNVALSGTVGSLDGTRIIVGGDLNIATIQNTDDVFLSADGDAVVDTLNAVLGSAVINGTSVTLNNGNINANLALDATTIDGAGNDSVSVGGLTTFIAVGDINFDSFTAGAGFNIRSATGNVNFTNANTQSGSIVINADNINGASIRGGLDGIDAGNDFITVDATGNIALTGTVGSLDGTRIIVGGDLNIATIQNTDEVFLSAGGDAAVDTLNTSLGSATINGASVTLNNGAINANLTLNATGGDVAGNGIITLGGFANFDATGDIGFGAITAGTDFDIDVAGDVTFVEANTRSGNITIDANNITGGSVRGGLDGSDAGNDFIAINAAGNIALTGTVGSLDGTTITSSGDMDIGTIQNFDNVLLTATGAAAVDTLNTTVGSATVIGASVTLNNGDINANLTLNATAGDVAGNDTIALGGVANFDATDSIDIGNITANTIDFDAGQNIFFDSLTSPNAVSLITINGTIGRSAGAGDITSGGAIDLNGTATDVGILDAATTITVTATDAAMVDNAISATTTSITGGSVTLNSGTIGTDLTLNAIDGDLDAQGGNFTADAGGDIVFNTAMASGDLNFNAGGQITGNTVTLDAATGSVDLTGNQGIRIATLSASTADLVSNVKSGDGETKTMSPGQAILTSPLRTVRPPMAIMFGCVRRETLK